MRNTFLENLYIGCREINLVSNQQEFSKKILGRSPNYYSSILAKKLNVSTECLLRTSIKIAEIVNSKSYPRIYKIKAKELNMAINKELTHRVVED